jgi:Fungal specific transcription factor domain
MSDAKWFEMILKAMESSEALTCAVHANAVNYMAKAAGAATTPHQAYTEYAYALKFLQRDLYHPVKQTSNETLFAVLLLGIFDVLSPNIVNMLTKLDLQCSKYYSVESSSRWSAQNH